MKIDINWFGVIGYTLFLAFLLPIVSLYVVKLGTFGFYRGRFLFQMSMIERSNDGEVETGKAEG